MQHSTPAEPAAPRDAGAGYRDQQKVDTRASGVLAGVLVALLFPAWYFVDLALEPALASRFLVVRLAVEAPILALLGLLYLHPLGHRRPELLVFALLLVPEAAIAWMMPQLTSGFQEYLLGYTLVVYGAGFLVAWRPRWVVAVAVAMCLMLALAFLLHPDRIEPGLLAVATFYVCSSAIIAGVGALHRDRIGFREFTARHEAIRERDRAEGLRQRLEQISRQDHLTGAANRREWDDRLAQEWKRSFRSGSALSVLLIDLDHFKEINDTCGHDAGDAALRAITGLIRGRVRQSDLLARFGGDEFALLCPETAADDACRLGSELLARIRGLRLPQLGEADLTVSIGVAERKPGEGSAQETVQAADRQLYLAKRTRSAVWGSDRQWDHGPRPFEEKRHPPGRARRKTDRSADAGQAEDAEAEARSA